MALWLAALGCSGGDTDLRAEPLKPANPASPDLILVLVQRLRADPEGRPGAEQSVLNGLGRPPTFRFRSAYAQSPDGFASLGSLFTGHYTSAAPLCGLDPTVATSPPWCAMLPAERYTLPEVLGFYGYHTALFSSGTEGIAELVARGNSHVEEIPSPDGDPIATDWAALHVAVDAWWQASHSPRLLTLVVSDLALSRRPDVLRELVAQGSMDQTRPGEALAGDASVTAMEGVYTREAVALGRGLAEALGTLPDGAWTFLAGVNGISLREATGFLAPTLPLDSRLVLDRVVHVPLLVMAPGPGETPRTVEQPVELRDLFPTLTQLGGATVPAGLSGEDLLSLARTGRDDADAVAYTELGDMIGLRRGDHLLTLRTYSHHGCALDPALTDKLRDLPSSPAHFSLHDVRHDPSQSVNLLIQRPDIVADLRARMLDLRTHLAAPADAASSPEHVWDYRLSARHGYW